MKDQTGEQTEHTIELKPKKPIIYILPTAYKAPGFQEVLTPQLQATKSSEIVEQKSEDRTSFLSKIISFLNTKVEYESVNDLFPLVPYIPGGRGYIAVYNVVNKVLNRAYESSEKSINTLSEQEQKSVNIAVNFLEKNLSNWESFVESIPYSSLTEDYEFPPGHPLLGRFYRVHPLKSKSRYYIPIEVFDSLLYSERENELIRILVDLGATKISIQEISTGTNEGTTKAGVKITGAGGISSDVAGKTERSNTASRVTLLRGKNWTPNMEFDRTKYSWLPYEPAWEAIVHARLVGGCVSSSVELTSDTSYSVNGQLGLTEGLLENLGSFDVGANFARISKEKKLFVVEFADNLPDSPTT